MTRTKKRIIRKIKRVAINIITILLMSTCFILAFKNIFVNDLLGFGLVILAFVIAFIASIINK